MRTLVIENLPPNRNTIPARWSLRILTALTLVFVFGGFAIHWRIEKGLYDQADRSLSTLFRSEVGTIMAEMLASSEPHQTGLRGPGLLAPTERQDFLFQAWHADSTLASTRLANPLDPIPQETPGVSLAENAAAQGTFRTVACLAKSGPITARALTVRFPSPGSPGGRRGEAADFDAAHFDVIIGIDEASIRNTLASVRTVLISAGFLGLVASALTLLFVARKNTPSMDERRDELARLDATQADIPGEIQRETSFSSDVSHELQTPLTGLRLTMEMLLSLPRDDEAYKQDLRNCLNTTKQMQTLVRKLLGFARADRPMLETQEVDAKQLIEDTWQAASLRSSERGLTLEITHQGSNLLTTDHDLFERVVVNLVDNALEYADVGTTLEVRMQPGKRTGLAFVFSNPSKRTRVEDGDRALDSFWRADGAPSTVNDHYGLGLSLTKRIVRHLGGRIRACPAQGRFTIEMDLPNIA